MAKKILLLCISFILVLTLFSCTGIAVRELQDDITSMELQIMEQNVLYVYQEISTRFAGYTITTSKQFEMGIDPFYIYMEDRESSYIVYADENDKYYKTYLNEEYDEDKLYLSEEISEKELLDLNLITKEDVIGQVRFELPNLRKIDNNTYESRMKLSKLLEIDIFKEYDQILNGVDDETLYKLMNSDTTLEFNFDGHIQISIKTVCDLEYTHIDAIQGEITVTDTFEIEIISRLTPGESPIEVNNEQRFIMLDNSSISRAENIELDQKIDLSKNPYDYYGHVYYCIYLDEGYYQVESNDYNVVPRFYSDANPNIPIDVLGVFGIRSGIKIPSSGVYYVEVNLNSFTETYFMISKDEEEAFKTHENISLESIESYDYRLDGYYDYVRFSHNYDETQLVIIYDLCENTDLLVSRDAFYPEDVYAYLYNDERYYDLLLHSGDSLYLRNLNDQVNEGTIQIIRSTYYDVHNYDGDFLELTENYDQIFISYDLKQRINFDVPTSGTYLIEVDYLLYEQPLNAVLYFPLETTTIEHVNLFLGENNHSIILYLEQGQYFIHFNKSMGYPATPFVIRYTLIG